MLLAALASASTELATTSARSAKTARLAEVLATATDPAELRVAVSWLSGALTQRQIGVGWASLRSLPPAAGVPSLTVAGTERVFTEIGGQSGPGSQGRRQQLLADLLGRATDEEQQFLGRLLTGDLRQGALVGVMTDAVAAAAGIPADQVRRAAMLSGSLPEVAAAALAGGAAGLAEFQLQVGRPVGPMLAQTAASTEAALAALADPAGRAAFEWKLDGIRLQVHRDGDRVALFTRTLDDITDRLPEVVEAVRQLPATEFVADAEAIALRPDGRPAPFQQTSARLASRTGSAVVTTYVFDLLRLAGTDLLDAPAAERAAALAELVPVDGPIRRVPRLVTGSPEQAAEFLAGALAAGHEGVVAKSLAAPYSAGRRGAGWLKVKPVHTLDLVVLAVEWGSGRRTGKLSNIHLGARSADGTGFVMLGKTFKGMTDAMLAWQTARFTELADGPADGYVVRVRPEQVVEIAFDGVQRSTRYPGGVALRFARVLRYRDDKRPDEADTIETVRGYLP